jgi:hypothetical protein
MGWFIMNPLTLEWVDKAEGDFATAEREWLVRENPNYDAAIEPFWRSFLPVFQQLTNYAVEFRYPGESADQEDAIVKCRQVRRLIRCSMGLAL